MEAWVADRLKPRTPDLELGPGFKFGVVSLDKELYFTLSPFTQLY